MLKLILVAMMMLMGSLPVSAEDRALSYGSGYGMSCRSDYDCESRNCYKSDDRQMYGICR